MSEGRNPLTISTKYEVFNEVTYSEILGPDGSYRAVETANLATKFYADTGSTATAECVGTIARTDTAAKNLFTLPAGAIPLYISMINPLAANPSGTATVSVGKTGTNTFFVTTQDVKGTLGQLPCATATNLGAAVSASAVTQVVGIYAEGGSASSTGGPFTVILGYMIP